MNAEDLGALKKNAGLEIDRISERLWDIALRIHSHPELGWETPQAVHWLTEPLVEAGIKTEVGVAGLSSSFLAECAGTGGDGPFVAILAEYDALRGIGHGCGHNLIGTAAIAAGLAVKAAAPDLPGRLLVIGTPFEEGGGGKVVMVEKGLFKSCDAAMMCHPNNRSMVMRGGLASVHIIFRFHGKASHAAAAPEKGISALDAVLQLFFGINQLRQFAPQGYRIHGIITHGGVAPNVVPEFAEAEFIVRATNRRALLGLKKKVLAVAESAALATGARLEFEEGITYAERNESPPLSQAFAANLTSMGVRVDPPAKGIGSSDMGNVAEVCPAIHPYVKICDESISTHSGDFAQAAKSPAGKEGMLQAAKGLAMTALDLFYDDSLLARVKADFARYREEAERLS
jgi:amidohydrolase